MAAKIMMIELVSLVDGYVIGRAVNAVDDLVVLERVVCGESIVDSPYKEGAQPHHEIVDGVLTPGLWCATLGDSSENFLILLLVN